MNNSLFFGITIVTVMILVFIVGWDTGRKSKAVHKCTCPCTQSTEVR